MRHACIALCSLSVVACAVCGRFVPVCFPEHVPVMLEEDKDEKGNSNKEKKTTKRLELLVWVAAWDRHVVHMGRAL